MSGNKLSVFVIMPFSADFDDIYNDIIVRALEDDCIVERADTQLHQESIMNKVIRSIYDADLVLADLTGRNPNVFYELGIAHSLGKPTILITQSIDEIPTDLRAHIANPYGRDFIEARNLEETLQGLIREVRTGGSIRFGNPVSDALRSAEIAVHDFSVESVGAQDELETEAELGVLDHKLVMEESMAELVSWMEHLITRTNEYSTTMNSRTDQLLGAQASNQPSQTQRIHQIAKHTSVDMRKYASEVKAEAPRFLSLWDSILQHAQGFFDGVNPDTMDRSGFSELHETVLSLQEVFPDALAGLNAMKDATAHTRGFTRELTASSNAVEQALDSLIEMFNIGQAKASRLASLIEAKLKDQTEEI